MATDEQKRQQFFSHFGRLFTPPPVADTTEGLAGLAETPAAADFSDQANRERMERTKDELDRIVENYLQDDSHAAAIARMIRTEGGETLKRFGQQDRSLADDPNAAELLEAIVVTDGSRPTFLVRNGKVDRQSSVLGNWALTLDQHATQIENAIACVGRLDHPGVSLGYMGTGFLIQEDLVATNRHVLQAIAKWNGSAWQLSAEIAIDFAHEWNAVKTLNRRLVEEVVFASPREIDPYRIDHSKLDFALLRLKRSRSTRNKFFQLATSKAWQSSRAFVCTIGYPGPPPSIAIPPTLIEQLFKSQFGYKRLAPGELREPAEPAAPWTFAHDATTLGGNSGSVVISLDRETDGFAVGIHYGGKWSEPRENWGHALADVFDERDQISGDTLRDVLNQYGVQVAGVPEKGRPSRPRPERNGPISVPPVETDVPNPTPSPSRPTPSVPDAPLDPRSGPSGGSGPLTRRHVVTLQAMKFLGVQEGASRIESLELEAAGDGETPAKELANRNGYDPNFHDGWSIPLSQPSGDMRKLRRGGTGVELKYQHFSVILSASRRMPIITATNIDGDRSRRLPRIDKWSYDGRLNQEDQWGNELYQSNELDRGHMVRREDPVWGSMKSARRANIDTFHYTNSCPQMAGMNQKTWLGLEDYILKHTREDNMRISVFTGPFFSEDDMQYRGALIPKAYWKIVAFQLDDERPSATAYKVSQTRELIDLEFVFSAYKTFQISVQQVIDDTGIDFSELVPFDGFSTHEFVNGGRMCERIEDLSQIRV